MAAQRLGSILTNITGTSGQVLRVNTSETGFEFVSPAALPTYTVTNDTTDRVIDANDVTMDKVADVVSTLIKDMATIYNGGPAAFTWSTSEQVYPFEKAIGGGTLYCKEVSLGSLPNNGQINTAHNISNLDVSKIFKLWGGAYKSSTNNFMPLPYARPDSSGGFNIDLECYLTTIAVYDGFNYSSHTGWARIIYAK